MSNLPNVLNSFAPMCPRGLGPEDIPLVPRAFIGRCTLGLMILWCIAASGISWANGMLLWLEIVHPETADGKRKFKTTLM